MKDTPYPFRTRKPSVTDLNSTIYRIELYIVFMGKPTFVLLFIIYVILRVYAMCEWLEVFPKQNLSSFQCEKYIENIKCGCHLL